jgi:hypothetical protein
MIAQAVVAEADRGLRWALSPPVAALWPKPPQFGLGTGMFDECFRAATDGFLEALFGGGAVALQQVPFADVELRLAALFRLLRGGERGRCIMPPEMSSNTA